MSEHEDDLYDDEDDSIFEDEESEDEIYDEDSDLEDDYDDEDDSEYDDDDEDSDLEDDYDDEDDSEYDDDEEESLSSEGSCFVCNIDGEDIPEDARWKFAVSDEERDRVELWACKSCRDKFKSLEEFDKFRTDWIRSSLYRCAAQLQRLILLNAPDCLVANSAFIISGYLFADDSDGLKPYAAEELKKLINRVGGK